jgi:hypothetical protein
VQRIPLSISGHGCRGQQWNQVRVNGRERTGERCGDDVPEGAGTWARLRGVIELT